MKIDRISIGAFSAKINLGTQIGYSNKIISEDELIGFIQEYQEKLIQEKTLYLSICLSRCKIILSGQVEPHFQLSFINYPKFPLEVDTIIKEIEEFTKALMTRFSQNRVVLELPEKTIMFELSDIIDPRIKLNHMNDDEKR